MKTPMIVAADLVDSTFDEATDDTGAPPRLCRHTDYAVSQANTDRGFTVLQFGSGNFLRAFADWMIQRSNNAGLTDHKVAVTYATNRPDRNDPLQEQGGLFHVCLDGVSDGQETSTVELIDCIHSVVDPFQDWDRFQQIALDPSLEIIISNTTEAGLRFVTDDFRSQPAQSFPAQLACLLHDRFVEFAGDPEAGLCIVPCELVEDNGDVLKEMVLAHAENADWGKDFVTWVNDHNHFYNTLVDRIVSGYPTDAAEIHRQIGVTDLALVKGELFSLWTIGGSHHLRELLPLDQLGLGAEFLPKEQVRSVREKKVRVLNGAHTALAQVGLLQGLETVFDAFSAPAIRSYLKQMVEMEILPTIVGNREELDSFASSILERFDNPHLQHRLTDIALNSLSKWQSRNLPVILECWRAGREAKMSSFVLAGILALYCGDQSQFQQGHLTKAFSAQDESTLLSFIRDSYCELLSEQITAENLKVWVTGIFNFSDILYGKTTDEEVDRMIEEVSQHLYSLHVTGLAMTLQALLPKQD